MKTVICDICIHLGEMGKLLTKKLRNDIVTYTADMKREHEEQNIIRYVYVKYKLNLTYISNSISLL